MAQRRMFSKQITNSSSFQMMSPSAQSLYFHIGMNADDDGFCEIFTLVRMTESKPDDLRALHEREFIFIVDNKVAIVKDWHENNYIQADRYTPSKYLKDAKLSEIYKVIMSEKIKHLQRYNDINTKCIQDVSKVDTQVRLGKDRLIPGEAEASQEKDFEFPSLEEFLESEGYAQTTKYLGEEMGEQEVYVKPGSNSYKTEQKINEEYQRHIQKLGRKAGVLKEDKKPEYQVFALFSAIDPNYSKWWRNKTQITAAKELFEIYGIEKIKKAIAFYIENKDQEFIPRIFSPHELLNKYQALKDFKSRNKKNDARLNFASDIKL